jgi:hypothetical protein
MFEQLTTISASEQSSNEESCCARKGILLKIFGENIDCRRNGFDAVLCWYGADESIDYNVEVSKSCTTR